MRIALRESADRRNDGTTWGIKKFTLTGFRAFRYVRGVCIIEHVPIKTPMMTFRIGGPRGALQRNRKID